ncbi:MAG: hypothetical protein VX527_13085 [Planctomycetota bacterium]|nr:hypothetical protein [Planctomycetota bacterium]
MKAVLAGAMVSLLGCTIWAAFQMTGDDSYDAVTNTFPYFHLKYAPWELILTFVISTPLIYCGLLFKARRRLKYTTWCNLHDWSYAEHLRHPLEAAGFEHPLDGRSSSYGRFGDRHRDFFWKDIQGRKVLLNRFDIPTGDDSSTPAIRLIMETGTHAPDILFRHRNLNDMFSLYLGTLQPVNFELDVFNRQWTVLSRDPRGTYDFFDQSTLELLVGTHAKLNLELHNSLLLVYWAKRGIHHREWLIRFAESFAAAVPNDLIKPIHIMG